MLAALNRAITLLTAAALATPMLARPVPSHKMPSVAENRDFRLKMLASYGPSTWDDLLIARRCKRCGWVAARQAILPGSSRPDSPAAWMARSMALARSTLHRPCPSCRSTVAGPGFMTRMMASVAFLEAGGDLQLVREVERDREPAVTLSLARQDGKIDRFEWPIGPDAFERKTGAPFSVRAVWKKLIAAHGHDEHPAFRRVQDGYFLLIRPRIGTDEDVLRIKKETVAILDNLSRQAGSLHVEGLKDLEDLSRPFTRDTYHDWLSEHASSISTGEIGPMAAVHPPAFLETFAKEARVQGVDATIPSTKALEVVLTRGPWKLKVNCIATLLRMIHQGQSFQQGVSPLLEDVNRLVSMERLAVRIATLIGDRCTGEGKDGDTLVITPRDAKGKATELNLASLVDKVDAVKDPDARLARVIGWDTKSRAFREVTGSGDVCQCGQPTTLGIKIRPDGFFTGKAGRVLAERVEGLLVVAARECPDHVSYLSPGKPFKTLEQVRREFAGKLGSISFPIGDVGRLSLGNLVLPYAVGQDLSTAILEPPLVAGLVRAIDRARRKRFSEQPRQWLPGEGGRVTAFAPYQHVVVLAPRPLSGAERARLTHLLIDALSGPLGRTDPGVPLGLARDHTIDGVKPSGLYELR